MKRPCQICQRPTDNPTQCHPECLEDYILELDSLKDRQLTGDTCTTCGNLLTVQDRATTSPNSCADCRRKENESWLAMCKRDTSIFNQ